MFFDEFCCEAIVGWCRWRLTRGRCAFGDSSVSCGDWSSSLPSSLHTPDSLPGSNATWQFQWLLSVDAASTFKYRQLFEATWTLLLRRNQQAEPRKKVACFSVGKFRPWRSQSTPGRERNVSTIVDSGRFQTGWVCWRLCHSLLACRTCFWHDQTGHCRFWGVCNLLHFLAYVESMYCSDKRAGYTPNSLTV